MGGCKGEQTRDNGHKLKHKRLHLNLRKKLFYCETGTGCPGGVVKSPCSEIFKTRLDTTPHCLLNSCNKVSPEPSLLQAEQPQFSQPVLIGEVFQPSDHFCGPLLDPLQQAHVFPVLRAPELDAVLQLSEAQGNKRQGVFESPAPAKQGQTAQGSSTALLLAARSPVSLTVPRETRQRGRISHQPTQRACTGTDSLPFLERQGRATVTIMSPVHEELTQIATCIQLNPADRGRDPGQQARATPAGLSRDLCEHHNVPIHYHNLHYGGRSTQPISTDEIKENKVIVRAEERRISCSRKQVVPETQLNLAGSGRTRKERTEQGTADRSQKLIICKKQQATEVCKTSIS
ncbi:hypothetical protein QYF61_022297, partial [Mycteria americana]